MKKNVFKITLDVIMFLILVMLYNSHIFALSFHEIAGLSIFALFAVHMLVNRKWIVKVSTKFFDKALPVKTKIGYIVDLLLVITFVLIIISGIITSQVLFPPTPQDSPWRAIHHFFAAISIILVGVHIGLHWAFVSSMFKKMIKLPPQIAKPVGAFLLVIMLLFGAYSMATSNFSAWIVEPFVTITKAEPQMAPEDHIGDTKNHTAKAGENKSGGNISNSNAGEKTAANDSLDSKSMDTEKKAADADPITIINTIVTFLSIIGVFAAITRYVEKYFITEHMRTFRTNG